MENKGNSVEFMYVGLRERKNYFRCKIITKIQRKSSIELICTMPERDKS